ncbi:hypothetical protein FNV43_RR00048 [Rhamnella rubrinervis]|uniref:Uncharacterized protein n=1 Tax=Rhamnella rubrinervis TaxID=2594499 RepID=A0A8K0MRM7_9ROSA|nr:hypothetical protein FNV43_RR00048 [Rhamnella rubrinervis]
MFNSVRMQCVPKSLRVSATLVIDAVTSLRSEAAEHQGLQCWPVNSTRRGIKACEVRCCDINMIMHALLLPTWGIPDCLQIKLFPNISQNYKEPVRIHAQCCIELKKKER